MISVYPPGFKIDKEVNECSKCLATKKDSIMVPATDPPLNKVDNRELLEVSVPEDPKLGDQSVGNSLMEPDDEANQSHALEAEKNKESSPWPKFGQNLT